MRAFEGWCAIRTYACTKTFMRSHGLSRDACRHHLANRIYITHFFFHYSSWKGLVIGFFFFNKSKQFLTPHLPEIRFVLVNYIQK